MKKSKDGVELECLGEYTMDEVINCPQGIHDVSEDQDFYYVFPHAEPGSSGDHVWMVNKKTKEISGTNISTLVVYDVYDKLTDVPIDEFLSAME